MKILCTILVVVQVVGIATLEIWKCCLGTMFSKSDKNSFWSLRVLTTEKRLKWMILKCRILKCRIVDTVSVYEKGFVCLLKNTF